MKRIIEWFILIWTGLLVLLITGWILKEFYGWAIEIVAAIIGFVGAIFGGLITWFGVKATIESNKLIEDKKDKKEQLMYLYPFKREIEKIYDQVSYDVYYNHVKPEDTVRDLYRLFRENNNLFDYAQRSGAEIYRKLYEFKDFVDFTMQVIHDHGEVDDVSDEELTSMVMGKFDTIIKDVEKAINERENN